MGIGGHHRGIGRANYGNSRGRIKLDFWFFFYGFTFYLPDLLIGVGFVMGVTFTTHLPNVNFIDF